MLTKAATNLLWAFIITMVVMAVIVISQPNSFYYQVNLTSINQYQQYIDNQSVFDQEPPDLSKYKLISEEEYNQRKKETNTRMVVAFVCILGILFSLPEKRQRLIKLYKSFRDGERHE